MFLRRAFGWTEEAAQSRSCGREGRFPGQGSLRHVSGTCPGTEQPLRRIWQPHRDASQRLGRPSQPPWSTVAKVGAPQEIRRAYGVGQRTDPARVRDVKAALQQIISRATSAPEEAAGFGLIAADVAALTTFLVALTDANTTQEKKRAHAPLSTKERNLTANRILQAAVLIAGAGMRVFADSPPTHAIFEALMAGTKKAAPSRAKKNAEPPKAAESAATVG